jgi:hypothetical protein
MRSENYVAMMMLTPTRTLIQDIHKISKRSSLSGTPCVYSRRRSLILLLKRNDLSEMSTLRKCLQFFSMAKQPIRGAKACHLLQNIYRASDRRYCYIPSLPSIFVRPPNTQKIVQMFETSLSQVTHHPETPEKKQLERKKSPIFYNNFTACPSLNLKKPFSLLCWHLLPDPVPNAGYGLHNIAQMQLEEAL